MNDSGITTAQATTHDTTDAPPATTNDGATTTTGATATTAATAVEDVGPPGLDVPSRCGSLDIVFVVERSLDVAGKMWDVADALPGQLKDALPEWNIRYLHVSSAATTIPPSCEVECENAASCDVFPATACAELDECDWRRGAGVVWKSLETRCIEGAQRWVDAAHDEAGEIIRCLWHGGGAFGGPDSMASLLTAIGPTMTGNEGCNAGFLGDDAWLMPVMTLRGQPKEPLEPAAWAGALFDAKGGDPEAVVPVALLDPEFIWSDPPGCEDGPGDMNGGYHAFIDEFPVAVLGDLCKPYTPQIMAAVAHMAEVCKVGETPE